MTLIIEKFSAFCVNFLLVFGILIFLSFIVSAQGGSVEKVDTSLAIPADFVSDGCTKFPNGNYLDCCYQHDLEYYYGGSWKQRWRADKKLYRCVVSKPKFYNKLIAPMMWLGVRAFGVPWLPTDARWGFGVAKKKTKNADKKKDLPAKAAN